MDEATRARLTALYKHILSEIAAVDKVTPWQENEPQWWLEMMQVERATFKAVTTIKIESDRAATCQK